MFNFTTCAIHLPFEDHHGGKKMDLEEETLLDYTVNPTREGDFFLHWKINSKDHRYEVTKFIYNENSR